MTDPRAKDDRASTLFIKPGEPAPPIMVEMPDGSVVRAYELATAEQIEDHEETPH